MTNFSSDHIVARARYLLPLAGLAIISLLGLHYTSNNIDNNKNIEYETPSYENVLRQLELVTQDANSQPHLRKLPTVCVSGVCLETTNSPTSTPLPDEPFNATKLDDIDDACQMTDILGPTEIPVDTVFENTIIVGYPGADSKCHIPIKVGWYGWVIDYWMEGVSSSIMQLFISSTSFF